MTLLTPGKNLFNVKSMDAQKLSDREAKGVSTKPWFTALARDVGSRVKMGKMSKSSSRILTTCSRKPRINIV